LFVGFVASPEVGPFYSPVSMLISEGEREALEKERVEGRRRKRSQGRRGVDKINGDETPRLAKAKGGRQQDDIIATITVKLLRIPSPSLRELRCQVQKC